MLHLKPEDFQDLLGSNLEPPLRAVEYHYKTGSLRDCYLIATLDTDHESGSKDVPPVLEKWFKALYPESSVVFHHGDSLCVSSRDYVELWRLVDKLFLTSTHKPEHIIADVTSGTKLMSVGVALACLPEKRTMQYMSAGRDWRGEPLKEGQLTPILVDIDPFLEQI